MTSASWLRAAQVETSLHLDNRHAVEHAREHGPNKQGPVRAHQVEDDRVLKRSGGHDEEVKNGWEWKGRKLDSIRLPEDSCI